MTAEPTRTIEIFFAYAHKDEKLLKELEMHLMPLKRQGLITEWHDRRISAGAEWASEIDAHLNQARIILLLVSSDFLASDYCYGVEIQRAMERHKAGEARVIPILLRPVDWRGTPFDELPALPRDAKPVTEWSNRDQALFEVVNGIRKAIEELRSRPATSPPLSVDATPVHLEKVPSFPRTWNVPYPRNPFFTDRDSILEELHRAMTSSKITGLVQPQAISGLGAIGKTQIAIEYAYRYQDHYEAILWVRGDSQEIVVADVVSIASLLNVPAGDTEDQRLVVNAVKSWMEAHANWLLILDNVDNPAIVSDFLPWAAKGHILLTTRAQAVGSIARKIEIKGMPPEVGALFLLRRAAIIAPDDPLEKASSADRTKAKEVSQAMDGLPLALDQAAAYIKGRQLSLSDYLNLYQTRSAELLKRRGYLVPDRLESLTSTLSLAFEKVDQANSSAADLLRLCAFLHPDGIPEELLLEGSSKLGPVLQAAAADPIEWDATLETLLNYSLIRRDPATKTLSVPRLVQVVLKDGMDADTQRQWAERAVQTVNSAFPEVEYATWSRCQQCLPHAKVCATVIEQWNMVFPEAARLLQQTGIYLCQRMQYAEAEQYLRLALTIDEKARGPEHPKVALSLNTLAMLYVAQAKLLAAESLLQRALAITRATQGEAHPSFIANLNSLADLNLSMGDFTQAEVLYQQALEIRRTALGEGHPSFAASLDSLANLHYVLGDFVQAKPLYQQALTVRRQAFGPAHPEVAQSLKNLAVLHEAMGDYIRAESFYQQALMITRAALGEAHVSVAQLLNNLAAVYQLQGKSVEAELLYQQALEMRRTALGEAHPEVAQSLDNLARLYQSRGNYVRAESRYQQALEIRRTTLGEAHPAVARSLDNLAQVYQAQGKYAQAEPLLQRALEIRRTTLGEAHLEVAQSLDNLARLYQSRGNYVRAESRYQQALEIRRTTLGEAHPAVARSLDNLAQVYQAQGKYAQAEPLLQRALEIRRTTLGEAHLEVAQSLDNLARLYIATGRKAEALTLMERAAAIDNQMTDLVFSIGSESKRRTYLKTLRENLDIFLSLVLRYLSASPMAVRASLDVVLHRKAIETEAFAARPNLAASGKYRELAPQLEELAILRAQIARKVLAGPGREDFATYQELLARWNARKERLEADLAWQVPEINLEQKLRDANSGSIALALPAGMVLVEYVRFNAYDFNAQSDHGELRKEATRYLAIILHAGEPDHAQMIDLGIAEPIDQVIAEFRSSLTSNQLTSGSKGRALRMAIFDPLLPALGGQRYLALAPEGDLTLIPFEVLPTDSGHYLIDDYHFSYFSTGRDVLRLGVEFIDQPAPPLVVADPDFDLGVGRVSSSAGASAESRVHDLLALGSSSPLFGHLPGSRTEGQHIASLLGVEPLLEGTALKARIKAYHSPSILHIATHGFFFPGHEGDAGKELPQLRIKGGEGGSVEEQIASTEMENPLLRSGLALAGANTSLQGGDLPPEAEDGLLTAEDILNLDLSSTRLVVLSACQTGLSEVRKEAFVRAGARTLVMNLWQVSDQEKQELLENFYRHILAGRPPADALCDAQLAMKAKYPAPLSWGGFICQGDLCLLPVRPSTFVEASDPYVVGRPVEGDLFVGRRDILKMIQDNLKPAAGKNVLVLRGQRRTGKTSVLLRVRETLASESNGAYLPVFVDLEGMSGVKNEGQFYYFLADQIRSDLAPYGVDVPVPALSDFEQAPTIVFKLQFLKSVTTVLGERQILLMLDEFETLMSLIERGCVSSELLGYCRHLMQHTPLLFLIAGTHTLRELTGDYLSVFFNLAVPIDIGVLKEPEAKWLITGPIQQCYSIEPLAVNEIVRVTGCHPYFTQMLCKKLLEVRNEVRLNTMTVIHVREAMNRALQSDGQQIGYPWTEQDCSPDERLVLSVLAREDANGISVSARTLQRRLDEAGLNAAIGKAINRLQERGVIRQEHEGRLAFVVPLFQHWIARKHFHTLAEAVRYNEEHRASNAHGDGSHV